jgi:hypothetical protein
LSTLKRRILLRTLLVVALVFFGVFLVFIGKRHVVVFANEEIQQNGEVFPALDCVRITAGEEKFELESEDRIAIEVAGLKNVFLIETLSDGVIGKSITFPLSLKLERMVIVSLPLVAAGSSDVIVTE